MTNVLARTSMGLAILQASAPVKAELQLETAPRGELEEFRSERKTLINIGIAIIACGNTLLFVFASPFSLQLWRLLCLYSLDHWNGHTKLHLHSEPWISEYLLKHFRRYIHGQQMQLW